MWLWDMKSSFTQDTYRRKDSVEFVEDPTLWSEDQRIPAQIAFLSRYSFDQTQIYTFQNIVYHVLHQRVPEYSYETLTQWWNSQMKWLVLQHILEKTVVNLALVDKLDVVGRTSELARVFGIDFFSVLSRGSQVCLIYFGSSFNLLIVVSSWVCSDANHQAAQLHFIFAIQNSSCESTSSRMHSSCYGALFKVCILLFFKFLLHF